MFAIEVIFDKLIEVKLLKWLEVLLDKEPASIAGKAVVPLEIPKVIIERVGPQFTIGEDVILYPLKQLLEVFINPKILQLGAFISRIAVFWNADWPIEVNWLFGVSTNAILLNVVQFIKALAPIVITFGKLIKCNFSLE